jgi:hypothetical protein
LHLPINVTAGSCREASNAVLVGVVSALVTFVTPARLRREINVNPISVAHKTAMAARMVRRAFNDELRGA